MCFRGGSNFSGRGGRGSGRGGRGGRGGRTQKKSLTAEELDAQLNKYRVSHN